MDNSYAPWRETHTFPGKSPQYQILLANHRLCFPIDGKSHMLLQNSSKCTWLTPTVSQFCPILSPSSVNATISWGSVPPFSATTSYQIHIFCRSKPRNCWFVPNPFPVDRSLIPLSLVQPIFWWFLFLISHPQHWWNRPVPSGDPQRYWDAPAVEESWNCIRWSPPRPGAGGEVIMVLWPCLLVWLLLDIVSVY